MAPKSIKSNGSEAKPNNTEEDEEPIQFGGVLQVVHDMNQSHGCTVEEIVVQLQPSSSTSRDLGELGRQVRRALRHVIQLGFLVQHDGRFKICTSRKSAQSENRRKHSPTPSTCTDGETESTSEYEESTTDASYSSDTDERNRRHGSGKSRRRRRSRQSKQKPKSKERRKSSFSSTSRSRSGHKKKEPPPEKSRPDEDQNNQQQQQQQNDNVLCTPSTSQSHRHTHKTNRGWGRHLMDGTPERDDPERHCELRKKSLEPREPSLDHE